MNFIKKKIKIHKKGLDKEDEFHDIAHNSPSALEGNNEGQQQSQKDTEEWQFFQQLTQRVQDTVQKTQTTLTKLKDSSAISEINKPDYISDSDENEPKPLPPSAQSWIQFEDDSTDQTLLDVKNNSEEITKQKPVPPRPPPPKLLSKDTVEPLPIQLENTRDEISAEIPVDVVSETSLLDEFGFQTETTPIPSSLVQASISNLLGLEEQEELGPDPFDTSFVDTSGQILIESKANDNNDATTEKLNDGEIDPFDTSFVCQLESLEVTEKDVQVAEENFSDKSVKNKFSLEKGETISTVELDNTVSQSNILESEGTNIDDTMSNPFLSDSESQPSDFSKALFNTDSQSSDFFGASKPKSTTNPFESGVASQGIDLLNDAFVTSTTDNSNLLDQKTTLDQCLFDPFGFVPNEKELSDTELIQPIPQTEGSQSSGLPTDHFDLLSRASEGESLSTLLEEPFNIISSNTVSEDLFSIEPNVDQTKSGFSEQKRDSLTLVEKDAVTSPEQILSHPVSKEASVEGFSESTQPVPSESRKMSSAIDELDDFFGSSSGQNVAKSIEIGSMVESEANKIEHDPFATIFGETETVKDTSVNIENITSEFNAFDEVQVIPVSAALDDLIKKPDASSVNPFETSLQIKSSEIEGTDEFDPFGSFLESNVKNEPDISIVRSDTKSNVDESANTIADPFDTSMMQPELIKDAIPFTETAAFEAFAAKFEEAIEKLDDQCVSKDEFDPFGSPALSGKLDGAQEGFGELDAFDPFLSMTKPPENTPTRLPPQKELSQDSFDDDDGPDFSVVIRPKMRDNIETSVSLGPPPVLPPPPKTPPKSPVLQQSSKFNPFDVGFDSTSEAVQDETASVEKEENLFGEIKPQEPQEEIASKKADSLESPTTPLFDEDTSQPLEEFPIKFEGDGWEMMLRQPNKKKITGNRFWKKVYIRLSDGGVIQLFNKKEDNDPFQELPLQACYSLSEIGMQQFDAYGKIFTVKLQYIFYRERVGVRPGQISKVMQGHLTSVGQIAKLGLPLEHAPQVSQLLKLGTQVYADIKTFVQVVDDALFHLTIHRDRSLTYKTEEVQVTVQDEFYVYQDKTGHVCKQLARVRIFFLAFITGMPDVEVGLNDLTRQGKEVVGRYDIIPVVTEEWIRLESCEFHSCVVQEEFENNRIIKLHPPDACLFELMRFRIRPPKNRELPLQVKAVMLVTKARIELRTDVLVPGYHSRKHGQVPCEDIQLRFSIPECWVYLFRVEKHFRYGSLKSAARKPGKIKGLERIMGTAQSLDPSMIEVSTGHAKYEHAFKAIVWRIPRLPKEGQGAYTTHLFLLRLDMTSFDQIPETLSQHIDVEFSIPATTVSHTTVRSVSVTNSNPPEKYVRYVSKHEYKVEIEFMTSPTENEYITAAATLNTSSPPAETPPNEQDEDDDSD